MCVQQPHLCWRSPCPGSGLVLASSYRWGWTHCANSDFVSRTSCRWRSLSFKSIPSCCTCWTHTWFISRSHWFQVDPWRIRDQSLPLGSSFGEMVLDICTRTRWLAKRSWHRHHRCPKGSCRAQGHFWKSQPQHSPHGSKLNHSFYSLVHQDILQCHTLPTASLRRGRLSWVFTRSVSISVSAI